MKVLLLVLLISGAQADDLDTAIKAASDFDLSYGDTISESPEIEDIAAYKTSTVIMNDKDQIQGVRLINDYKTVDGKLSTLEAIQSSSGEVKFTDINTGDEL